MIKGLVFGQRAGIVQTEIITSPMLPSILCILEETAQHRLTAHEASKGQYASAYYNTLRLLLTHK